MLLYLATGVKHVVRPGKVDNSQVVGIKCIEIEVDVKLEANSS